jgi:phage RecT family recombinase
MTDTNLTTTGKHPRVQFIERIEARTDEIRKMLPSDISTESFIRAANTGAQLNPEILACNWVSLWDALVKACRAGLLPDGEEGALVPYKTKATFVPMVQGVLRKARRSGQIKWIDANVVRAGEKFEYWISQDGPHFMHIPGEEFQAPIVRAYAIATTKDGGQFIKVMSKKEIDKHRAFSRASREDSPWNQWYEAMAIKTAIHGLGKYLPSIRDAMRDDETIIETPIAPVVVLERASEGQRPTDSRPAPQSAPVDDTHADGPEGIAQEEFPPSNTPAADPEMFGFKNDERAKK